MNWKRLVSCVLVMSMILGSFSLMANDAQAGLDYITDLGSPQATYRGQDWHQNGDFMIAVGNDSAGNGIIHKYTPNDGLWGPLATTGDAIFNAVANVEAFAWYDNMEMGVNGWTRNSWYTTETLVGYTMITNVWELQNITNDLTGKYALANDIDASITAGWNTGAGFDPIGIAVSQFEGSFEGAGHTIYNLYINRPGISNIGLFGYTDSTASIANVSLKHIDITGGLTTGGLVGYNFGFVNSSSTSGTVNADGANVGGLVGQHSGTIYECSSTATVTGTQNSGGLIGYCYGEVTHSYATSDVTGSITVAGGLTGYLYNCYLNDSYATGRVNCPDKAGGLVGSISLCTIINSYSTGPVTGSTNIGGLIGFGTSGAAFDSFWDTQTSGHVASIDGIGKTTVEMMQQATFTNWDFTNIWNIDDGTSYPYIEIELDLFAQWVQGNPTILPAAGSGTSHGTANSGSNIWWFGRPTTGNYDDGTRIAGSLISPQVTLPAISSISAIVFSHWFEVESSASPIYESMIVSIKNTTDSGWYELRRWDSSNTSFCDWSQEVLMFQGWQGNSVQINFTFDSQDEINNDFAGWHLDDILLYSNDVYIVVGEPTTGSGYSAYATDGYSTFVDMGVNSFDFNDVAAGSYGHTFLAVGDGGNVQYYDGVNWNTIFGAKADDTLTGVTFNGTHWFIVGYNSTGAGRVFYYTQAEFHYLGRVILHPIWGTPDWKFNDIAWSNEHQSHKQRPGLGAIAADGSLLSFGDPEIWSRENPVSGNPPARMGADMTYVLTSGVSMMFGGTNTAYSNETWLHSNLNNQWFNYTTAIAPPARYGCEIVFDPLLNATILFGGYNATTYMDDTWIFWVINSTWFELSPVSSPPGRYRHEMVYDDVNERIIMFGGETNGGVVADTWQFSGGNWVEITPGISPPARMAHAMTYNQHLRQVILFAGEEGAGGTLRNDTWTFNVTSGQWTNVTPIISPPVRFRHEIVYDRYNGYTILFGGHNGGSYLGDTWIYVPTENRWFNLYPNVRPNSRRDFSFIYDYSDGEPKLFGGMDGAAISDTWQCSFLTPWSGDVTNQSTGTNGENFTAVAFDSTGQNALFIGHNATHGVVYNYDYGNNFLALVPGTEAQFPGHEFYDVGYQPNCPTQEAIIVGQSAFKILPNMADTSTRIYVNAEYPNILDIDFRDQATSISREGQQVDVDHTYTFFIEANYTVGGMDMWDDMSISLIAWYDEGHVGGASIPEPNWNTPDNRTRQFNITYDVDLGTTTLNYPAPDLEFTLDSTWADPTSYPNDVHRVYINVTFGNQTRMATGGGFGNGAAADILDKNTAHNDPFSWDYMFRIHDELNTDAFEEAFEEFGIVETVSVSVTGNPSGNTPPGSTNVLLNNPSQIICSSNTGYWVNVSIPNLLENGVGPANIPAIDVSVRNSNFQANLGNSQIFAQTGITGAGTDMYIWGIGGSPITSPENGTTCVGDWVSNYNAAGLGLDDYTQLDWWVTVQAGTPQGVYWAVITVTIDS